MSQGTQGERGFRGFQRFGRQSRAEASQQLAVFTLGALEYAIDIMRIRQIIRPQAIRPVPYAPDFVDGVIDLRGSVVPVVDMRRRFGLDPDQAEPRAVKFIIVRLRGRQLGLVVDSVVGVLRVRKSEIRPTPQWITGPEAAVFHGVCRREDGLVLLLDLERLLSTREALRLGDVTAARIASPGTPAPRAPSAPTPPPEARTSADADDEEDWDSMLSPERGSDG